MCTLALNVSASLRLQSVELPLASYDLQPYIILVWTTNFFSFLHSISVKSKIYFFSLKCTMMISYKQYQINIYIIYMSSICFSASANPADNAQSWPYNMLSGVICPAIGLNWYVLSVKKCLLLVVRMYCPFWKSNNSTMSWNYFHVSVFSTQASNSYFSCQVNKYINSCREW